MLRAIVATQLPCAARAGASVCYGSVNFHHNPNLCRFWPTYYSVVVRMITGRFMRENVQRIPTKYGIPRARSPVAFQRLWAH
jgi:hypothetical protein